MQSAARRAGARVAQQLRGFAAHAEVVSAEQSPFLRFGSPFPAQINMQQALAQLPEPKVTRLSNGMRVATESVPFAGSATVGVWIDAGSRFETDATNGAAHFLEHMAFKGTARRSQHDLEVEIEDMGAQLNAYTSREQTCFFAKVLGADVARAVDILADQIQHSTLDPAAVERERSTILREMNEIEGMPEEMVFDHLHATAFQHSPLGRNILGPAENVKALTRDALADYVTTNYRADRMVLVGTGAVEHGELVKAAEAAFAKLPTGGPSAEDMVNAAPSIFTGSEVRMRDPDQPLVHLAVAFKGASWTDPDAVALQVMQTLLGAWDKRSSAAGNMGSELSQTVAANGLADSVMAFNTNYRDTGLFGVYATADPHASDLEDLAWTIMHKVTGLCYSVDESAVARAKNALKASLLFQGDGSMGQAEELGRSLLVYGRAVPRAEMMARIDAVDAAAVKAVANRFVLDQEIAVSALGDTQFLPDYTWLRRRTFWLRY